MPADTDEIVVAANGQIYVAPVGSTAPTDIDTAWDAAWTDLGYASDDGVTLTDSKDLDTVNVWQLMYPARRIVTGRDFAVSFSLSQWNNDTVPLAFGGGTVNTDAGPPIVYTYEPPEPEDLDERAVGVEWVDGTKTYRLVVPRAMVTDNVETNLVRTGASLLPITLSVIGEDGVKPFKLITDDPSWAA